MAHLDGSSANEGKGRGQIRRGQGRGAPKGQRRAGAGAGKGRGAQSSDGSGQRAPRGARRAEVIADLEVNPGSKAGEIAGRVGINPNHAQTILANLLKQGIATKEGQQYTATGANA